MKTLLLFFLTLSALSAQDDLYETGRILYLDKSCNTCHGMKAEGMTQYPALANTSRGYLSYKLKHFRDGKADTQQQEMMLIYAKSLTNAEIEALVEYLSNFVDPGGERYDVEVENWGDGGS